MRFQNRENNYFVTIDESEINESMGTVKYTREDTGETFFIARYWFTKWFIEAPETTTASTKEEKMNDNQIINLNIGLNWTNGGESGQFESDHALFLLGVKFNFTLVEHEEYVSSWDDGNRTYVDNCVTFKITVPESQDYSLEDILDKVNSLRILLKQDAIAYDVWQSNGGRDSDVYYGPNPPSDKLEFDPSYFRYL